MIRQVDSARTRRGFTLVELLVVIAIIGILAGIVVPSVTVYITKARVARAVSEIEGLDLALTGMLTASGRSRFSDFISLEGRQLLSVLAQRIELGSFEDALNASVAAQGLYNQMFYELLRRGRDAEFNLGMISEVRTKLGSSYIDIGLDPWGQQYRFWMGPKRKGLMFLRSYRVKESGLPYVYDQDQYRYETDRFPGQPPADSEKIAQHTMSAWGSISFGFGFPAPRDLPVYIFSLGSNQALDSYLVVQRFYDPDPEFLGGGDDINNWDNEAGWEDAPS